jgi:hypothetical protein
MVLDNRLWRKKAVIFLNSGADGALDMPLVEKLISQLLHVNVDCFKD